jgi:hypothetical protein
MLTYAEEARLKAQVLLTLSGSAAGTGDIEEYRVGDEVRFVLF